MTKGTQAVWIEAIEAGTIRLEPWEQVKRRIEKDLLGRWPHATRQDTSQR